MDAYRQMREGAADGVRDFLSSLDNSDLRMAFRNGTDDLHEIADSAVPIHYGNIFEALLEGGLSSVEPEIDGATNPAQMAQFVLYDECLSEVHDAVERFKEDEEDERERFVTFLSERVPGDFEDCDAAVDEFDTARDSLAFDYEEIFEEWKGE